MKHILPAIFTGIATMSVITAVLVLKSAWGGTAMAGALLFATLLLVLAALCAYGIIIARRTK